MVAVRNEYGKQGVHLVIIGGLECCLTGLPGIVTLRPYRRASRDHCMHPAERAARALCAIAGEPEDAIFEGVSMWEKYLPQVRAVLDAINEPNEQMKEAGGEIFRAPTEHTSEMACQSDAANVWRYMMGAMSNGAP